MAPGLRRLVIRLISETRFPVMQSSHARRTERRRAYMGNQTGTAEKEADNKNQSDRHIVITTTTGHQSFSPLNTKHEWKSSPQQSRESDANRLFDSICHIHRQPLQITPLNN